MPKKNNNVTKTVGILIIAAISLSACGNNKNAGTLLSVQEEQEVQQYSIFSYVDEAEKLNNVLQTYDKPMQRLQTTSKKPSIVTGGLGTIIHVNPANLETFDGQPLGEKIDVELKEYCTKADLLRGNVATVSDGKLLVSGGAYYIKMSSDGKPLRIKQDKNIEVEFPKFSDAEMELFYGQRDSLEQMNWKVAQQRFRARKDEVAEETNNVKEVKIINYRNVMVTMSTSAGDRAASARTFQEAFRTLGFPIIDDVEITALLEIELEMLKNKSENKVANNKVVISNNNNDYVSTRIGRFQIAGPRQLVLSILGFTTIADTIETVGFSEEDPVLKKKKVEIQKAMYRAVYLNQLGWINVDRFINISDITQLSLTLNDSATVRSVCVFMVFKDFNSVLGKFYCSAVDTDVSFRDIPVGYNVRLIAYGFDEEGELYTHSSDFTLKEDEKLSINLQKSTNNDLDKLFAYK